MKIKREYVTLGKLYESDPLSKENLKKAFKSAGGMKSEIWKKNTQTRLFNANMGCCIPNIGDIVDGFEALDKTDPFDNGMTYREIDHAETLGWKAPGTVILLMCNAKGEAVCVSRAKVEEGYDSRWNKRSVEVNERMFPD